MTFTPLSDQVFSLYVFMTGFFIFVYNVLLPFIYMPMFLQKEMRGEQNCWSNVSVGGVKTITSISLNAILLHHDQIMFYY